MHGIRGGAEGRNVADTASTGTPVNTRQNHTANGSFFDSLQIFSVQHVYEMATNERRSIYSVARREVMSISP